jgi:hypothetical protein
MAPGFKPPPKIGYPATVVAWKQTLETLAHGYLDGDVRADPRKPAVCRSCGGHALCRVRELGSADEDDDGEDGE